MILVEIYLRAKINAAGNQRFSRFFSIFSLSPPLLGSIIALRGCFVRKPLDRTLSYASSLHNHSPAGLYQNWEGFASAIVTARFQKKVGGAI